MIHPSKIRMKSSLVPWNPNTMSSENFREKSINSAFVYRWFIYSGLGWGLMIFGIIISVIVMVTRPRETMLDWMLPIGILIASATAMSVLLFLAARNNRLKTAYAGHGGKTCPFCFQDAWASSPCCSKFPRNWGPIDLDRYWTDRSQNNMVAKSVKRGDPPEPLGMVARGSFGMVFIAISVMVVFLIGIVAMFFRYQLMAGTAYVFVFAMYIYIPILLFIQLWMVTNSQFCATGICSSCGHQQPPGNNKICSECGSKVDDSKVMAKMTTKRRVVSGVLGFGPILFILTAQIFGPMIKAGAATNFSNAALIPIAEAQTSFEQWALHELMTRTLNDEEKDLVFEAAMNQRREEKYFSSTRDLGPLVEQQILDGRLSPEQLETLRIGAWQSDLLVPTTVQVGETFMVTLSGKRKEDFLTNGTGTTILFDGVSINGDDFEGGMSSGSWTLQVDSGKDTDLLEFDVKVSIDESGTNKLAVRYWVLDRPYGGLDDDVDRNAEGIPIRPLDSTWMYPVVIEKNIEVRAAD